MTAQDAIHALWTASIATPIDLKTNGARDIAVALKLSLAGIFALYLKRICRERTSGIVISCGAITSSSILTKSTGVVISLLGNSRNSSVRGYEQRSDHCANRREMNGAHDVRPYSHNPHGNIFVAINPGPRRTNNQGD